MRYESMTDRSFCTDMQTRFHEVRRIDIFTHLNIAILNWARFISDTLTGVIE